MLRNHLHIPAPDYYDEPKNLTGVICKAGYLQVV